MTAPWASSSTGEPEASAAARTWARTPGSSSAGVVFGIAQTRREPAVRGRGQPGRDGLGVLVARLAQVGVEVDEPGRDDDAVRRRCRRPRRRQPGDRLEDPVRDDDLARSLATRGRVDQPGPADLEVRHRSAAHAAPVPVACVPASR